MALTPASTAEEIVEHLRQLGSAENRAGLARYGIKADTALGIPHGIQRKIAKAIGRNNQRSLALWETDIREARLIGAFSADHRTFHPDDVRRWVAAFDSWEMVDGVSDLFVDMAEWKDFIAEFAEDEREFVRRTAFAMMAWSVIHRKKEPEETFLAFLPTIGNHAGDGRNFVKKAVSWALRSIGKRSQALNTAATALADRLAVSADRAERWVGKDALRDLTGEKTLARLAAKVAKASAKS